MQPHVRSMSSEPPSSSRPPAPQSDGHRPQPSLPLVTDTRPPVAQSPVSSISYSPSIKRKPLPASALSPPPIPTGFQPVDVSAESSRSAVPPSASALHLIIDNTSDDHLHHETSDPHSYYLEASPTDEEPPRVSIEDFPAPPKPDPVIKLPVEDDLDPITSKRGMVPKPGERPPPLRMDSLASVKSMDAKKPASPGRSFTSFFMRKPTPSPGADSPHTDISDGRSPMPSPYPASDHSSTNSAMGSYFNTKHGSPQNSQDSILFSASHARISDDMLARCNALEAELKEISVELAGSIRRELDLEDLVEQLQSDRLPHGLDADRTSDYFSDSGASSLRGQNDAMTKSEADKVRREADQQRANMRVELSQKWQEEVSQRKGLEQHLVVLEQQLQNSRGATPDVTDARIRDLERRLSEERQVKENFEDLLTALRADLEQHRSQRNNLRDEVVPALKARVEGLEASLADQQRQPYSVSKMQQEIQALRDENAALMSARDMERGLNRNSMQFISEEDESGLGQRGSMLLPKIGGIQRSNTIGRAARGSLGRSGSLSRTNSVNNRAQQETIENAVEKLKSVEQQRDALHTTVKYLQMRQTVQQKQHTKKAKMLEMEVDRAQQALSQSSRKGGYEKEVKVLRAEINTLRRRADDALDQKWQCEKGLAGLKMDLDRNKQETANLQRLLQARDSDPDSQQFVSATLENAIVELQKERARTQESAAKIAQEQELAEQLEDYATRSEQLALQVKKQLQTNQALRNRLKVAVENGETDQKASASQISELQDRLKKLEDGITTAQLQSETAVMKHEEEVRVLRASHNVQLLRTMSNRKSNSNLLNPTPRSPMSPFFANSKRSPKLNKTTSGPGMALHEALRTEYLEKKVADLEKALADAESEMGEVVGRMNTAQISVAELEAERDAAIKQTRRLEAEIRNEQQRYGKLIGTLNKW